MKSFAIAHGNGQKFGRSCLETAFLTNIIRNGPKVCANNDKLHLDLNPSYLPVIRR